MRLLQADATKMLHSLLGRSRDAPGLVTKSCRTDRGHSVPNRGRKGEYMAMFKPVGRCVMDVQRSKEKRNGMFSLGEHECRNFRSQLFDLFVSMKFLVDTQSNRD